MLALVNARFSVLCFSGTAPATKPAMDEIGRLLRAGVTVYLVTPRAVDTTAHSEFVDAKLLNVYVPDQPFAHPAPLVLIDGPGNGHEALLKQLDQYCPAFNHSQYAIVHAPPSTHQGIMAGAGTGKTATMVRRVLFLLHMDPQLSPREIVMITFTREATHEMRQRLRGELVERYRLTGRDRYLQLLEEVGDMPVKTIHAYTRELVKRLGSVAGYSQNLQIREFRLERKQTLEERLASHMPAGGTLERHMRLHVYEFIDAANRFWEEMENKGLSLAQITGLDWGTATGESANFQTLLKLILPEAEERLQALKNRHDAVSLKDLTRQMDSLRAQVTNLPALLSPVPKYMFVDEFQDTDDTQIRLVAWLQQQLHLTLFIVGDVKQSIYRFRGAKHTAFTELTKALTPPAQLTFRELTKNYRTDQVLLDSMHPYFANWSQRKYLDYHPVKDRLCGINPGGEQIRMVPVTKQTADASVLRLIQEAIANLPAKERVALLVRTNRQARQIEELCEANQIQCVVDAGGDFWNSEPATDLSHLVSALLYPGDPTARLNLHESPFSIVRVPWGQILHLGGDPDKLLALLNVNANLPHPNWNEWLEALRSEPVLAVLRRIINDTEPAVQVFRRDKDQEDAIRYSRNLSKLLLTLQETFPSRTVSLHTICQYLMLKRATDREEDQEAVSADEIDAPVLCQTVHKAKGKQYHTVIIPFTGRPFRTDRDELLLEQLKTGGWKAGWRVFDDRSQALANDHHGAMLRGEEDQTAWEETRLLYVAMTRAKKRLWIAHMATNPNQASWSTLL